MADGQTGANEAVGRTGGRADARTRRKGADDRVDGGGKGADSRADRRTGPTRRKQADGRTGVLVVRRSGGRGDERVGLGLKGHIPRGWVHSWTPSPLASSERKCAGYLGVQWSPVQFHVKHPNLAPELTCLV